MWRRYRPLLLALAAQFFLLALVPARSLVARSLGTDVTLRTMPVDPYDLLSGYYVTLDYEVERPERATGFAAEHGDPMYVVVERAEPAWRFVRFATDRSGLAPDQLAIRARWTYGHAQLANAGRLYIPEEQRDEVEAALVAVGRRALVDARVGPDGTLALLRLRADGQTFGAD